MSLLYLANSDFANELVQKAQVSGMLARPLLTSILQK